MHLLIILQDNLQGNRFRERVGAVCHNVITTDCCRSSNIKEKKGRKAFSFLFQSTLLIAFEDDGAYQGRTRKYVEGEGANFTAQSWGRPFMKINILSATPRD